MAISNLSSCQPLWAIESAYADDLFHLLCSHEWKRSADQQLKTKSCWKKRKKMSALDKTTDAEGSHPWVVSYKNIISIFILWLFAGIFKVSSESRKATLA